MAAAQVMVEEGEPAVVARVRAMAARGRATAKAPTGKMVGEDEPPVATSAAAARVRVMAKAPKGEMDEEASAKESRKRGRGVTVKPGNEDPIGAIGDAPEDTLRNNSGVLRPGAKARGAGSVIIETKLPPPLPPYLGISDARKTLLRAFLLKAAGTDTWHDFHKTNATKTLSRLGSSYNIDSGKSVVQYQRDILELKKEFKGANAYEIFKDRASNILLLGNTVATQKESSEESLLDSLFRPGELTYKKLRDACLAESAKAGPGTITINDSLMVGSDLGGGYSKYSLKAAPAKVRGTYKSVVQTFKEVSEAGVRNYVLMIDASNLAMTQLKKAIGGAGFGIVHRIFIIDSIENKSDPATKVSKFDMGDADPNIQIYFLKDIGHHTQYTQWNNNGLSSTLLCGCDISTYSADDGTITADVTMPDGDTITIHDIGSASEIDEAFFLALQKLLEVGKAKIEYAFLYLLLKRAGDCCQALALLDRGRKYVLCDINGVPLPNAAVAGVDIEFRNDSLQILLNELQGVGKGGVEVGLLTHDKVLLVFALLLGLNVYFTFKVVAPQAGQLAAAVEAADNEESGSSNSVFWLSYFKNTLDKDPESILEAATEKYKAIIELWDSKAASLVANVNEIYDDIAATVLDGLTAIKGLSVVDYFLSARILLDKVRKMSRPTAEMTVESVDAKIAEIEASLAAIDVAALTIDGVNALYADIVALESLVNDYLYIYSVSNVQYSAIEEGSNLGLTFNNERTQLTELMKLVTRGSPLRDPNGSPINEHYIFFLNKILPALRDDMRYFERTHGATLAQVNGAYQLKDTDIISKITSRAGIARFKTLYKDVNSTLFGQVGGATSFDRNIVVPLLSSNVQIRPKYGTRTDAEYDTIKGGIDLFIDTRFEKDPNEKELCRIGLPLPKKINTAKVVEVIATIKELVKPIFDAEKVKKRLSPTELKSYIENAIIDGMYSIFNKWDSPDLTKDNIRRAINEYTTNENVQPFANYLDIGMKVTNETGDAYTVVDRALNTDKSERYWGRLLYRVYKVAGGALDVVSAADSIGLSGAMLVLPGRFQTLSPESHVILPYKFRLWVLDWVENKLRSVSEFYNDADAAAAARTPYFTKDIEDYIKKLFTIVLSTEYDRGKKFQESLKFAEEYYDQANKLLNEDLVNIAGRKYITRERVEYNLALYRAIYIIEMYKAWSDKMGELGSPYLQAERTLDKYQITRMLYFLWNESVFANFIANAAAGRHEKYLVSLIGTLSDNPHLPVYAARLYWHAANNDGFTWGAIPDALAPRALQGALNPFLTENEDRYEIFRTLHPPAPPPPALLALPPLALAQPRPGDAIVVEGGARSRRRRRRTRYRSRRRGHTTRRRRRA